MSKYSREEKLAVLARSRRVLREANETVQRSRLTRLRAIEALHAVRQMFATAQPTLNRMSPTARQTWHTRQRLLEDLLQAISERGI